MIQEIRRRSDGEAEGKNAMLEIFEQIQELALGIQSPCQRMIGVYNHLRNA